MKKNKGGEEVNVEGQKKGEGEAKAGGVEDHDLPIQNTSARMHDGNQTRKSKTRPVAVSSFFYFYFLPF